MRPQRFCAQGTISTAPRPVWSIHNPATCGGGGGCWAETPVPVTSINENVTRTRFFLFKLLKRMTFHLIALLFRGSNSCCRENGPNLGRQRQGDAIGRAAVISSRLSRISKLGRTGL